MIRKISKLTAILLTAAMLVLAMPAVAIGADINDARVSDDAAPIVAVVETAGGEIEVVTKGDTSYLFLPGVTDIKAVTVKYIGEKQLYVDDSDTYVSPDGTAVYDFSSGSAIIYEYDAAVPEYVAYEIKVMKGSSVPSMYFTLDEVSNTGYKDTLAWLNSDKENETSGYLTMVEADGTVVYDNVCETIKGRGNTSFVAPGIQYDREENGYKDEKKSLNIKLDKKTELIPGAGKMKKWSLVHMRISEAYHYDWTGLCYNLGLQTYRTLAGEGYYGNMTQYVDVYLDGEYRGVYILIERLDNGAAVDVTDREDYVTSESSRKRGVRNDDNDPAIAAGVQYYQYTADAVATEDFDITGGYLLETNFNNLEECGFITARGMYFDLKAPEACTREQVQYIAKYVQDFENALYSPTGYNAEGKHYSDYADPDSFANMILSYAFYQNWELFRTSTYAYIDVADSAHPKLTFGPAWDFETGAQILTGDDTFFGQHNTYEDKQQYTWLEPLWEKADFMEVLCERASALDSILDASLELGDVLDGVTSAQTFVKEAHDSLVMNWTRWGLEDYLDSDVKYRGHENDFDYYSQTYVDALITRKENWDSYWNLDEYLLGATVTGNREKDSGITSLYCDVNSDSAVSYQWYMVDEDMQSLLTIVGATGAYYTAEEPGVYVCGITGGNNAYWSGAKGDIFSEKKVTMMTKAFNTADATEVDKLPDEEHVAGDWEVAEEPNCTEEGLRVKRCTVCEGKEVLISGAIEPTGHDDGEWEVIREATEHYEGTEGLLCTVCGEVLDTRSIPKVYVNKFVDVDTEAWYGAAVEFAVTNELFNGVGENKFDPDGSMTRAMLVTVLSRLDGANVDNDRAAPFTDVKTRQWYTGAVIWAAQEGIVNGVGNNKFDPEGNVTREQVATILYRYAQYKGIETAEAADLTVFEDYNKIGEYAMDAMSWINGVQIIKGVSATKIAPLDNCTRAQVAEMLRLYWDKYIIIEE